MSRVKNRQIHGFGARGTKLYRRVVRYSLKICLKQIERSRVDIVLRKSEMAAGVSAGFGNLLHALPGSEQKNFLICHRPLGRPIHDLPFNSSLGAKQNRRQQANQQDTTDDLDPANCP